MSHKTQFWWMKLLPKRIRLRIEVKENLVMLINNSGWLIFEKIVRLLLGFFVNIWVVRYLGPSQFGELAYVLAYLALFQAFSTLGLEGIVVRDIARNKESAPAILGTAFLLRLLAGVICWICAVTIMALIDGGGSINVVLVALAGGGLIFQSVDTIDLWFQSQSQSRRTVIPKVIAYLIANFIKIGLILSGASLLAFSAMVAVEALLAAIGLFFSYKFYRCDGYWQRVPKMAGRLLREGWPFLLSGVSIMVYMRIDQIMIKEMLGEKALGIYAAIIPLVTVWQFIPMTILSSIAPIVARKKVEGEAAYWSALEEIFRVFSLVGWLTSLPIAFFAKYIVEFLYGERFEDSWQVLSIYSFTNLFINLGVAQSLWVFNDSKSNFGLYKVILGCAASLVFNFILIPNFGVVGAAWSAVIAQLVSAVLSNIYFYNGLLSAQIKALFFPFPRSL